MPSVVHLLLVTNVNNIESLYSYEFITLYLLQTNQKSYQNPLLHATYKIIVSYSPQINECWEKYMIATKGN